MCTRTVFCSSSWVWTRCGRDARACLAAPRALPAAELRYFTDSLGVIFCMRALARLSPGPAPRARHHPTRPDTPALVSRPAPAGLRLGRARGAARRAPRPPTPGARHLGCRVSCVATGRAVVSRRPRPGPDRDRAHGTCMRRPAWSSRERRAVPAGASVVLRAISGHRGLCACAVDAARGARGACRYQRALHSTLRSTCAI